jgi:hypothetical protein
MKGNTDRVGDDKDTVESFRDDSELDLCARCNEKKLVPASPDYLATELRLCLKCGVYKPHWAG